jgi:hypothetical protein
MMPRKLSSNPQPLVLRRDTRPVNTQKLLSLIQLNESSARFGDWFGYITRDSEAKKERITFVNPFDDSKNIVLDAGALEPSRRYLLNLTDAQEPGHAVAVNASTVQVWKESKLAKTFSWSALNHVSALHPVKLDSSHVIGIKRVSDPNSGPFFYTYDEFCFVINLDNGSCVSNEKIPFGSAIAVLHSQDEKKQGHFAVTTRKQIQVRALPDEKSKSAAELKTSLIKTIDCEQGGHVMQSSHDGKHWVTSSMSGGTSLSIPAKLFRVGDDYQSTEAACLGTERTPMGWFAGHFLHQKNILSSPLYATHPESLVTYVLFDCSMNVDLFNNRILKRSYKSKDKLDDLAFEFLSDEYPIDDYEFKQRVSESTGCLPATVSGVVCSYLTHNTQSFCPQIIFAPVIPECLPEVLHDEARKLQFELWIKDAVAASAVMKDVLDQLPAFQFKGKDSYQSWIRPFCLFNHDKRIKTLFDKMADEMEVRRTTVALK